MNFRKIDIADGPVIRELLLRDPSQQIVACFEFYYLWRNSLVAEYAVADDFLVFRLSYDGGRRFFFPTGSGDLRGIIEKMADGTELHIIKARAEQVELLGKTFPGRFTAKGVRDEYEYIYSADKFRTYRGSALQAKRNFVNYAIKNYDWSYEPVTAANLPECADFSKKFAGGGETFNIDNTALSNALDRWEKLALDGGVIRIDGRIAAMFIVTMLSDGKTAGGMFLRGDHGTKGVITLLYREFFRANTQYEYVSLAEDLGIEGLRKNKLSYHPDRLLELYDIIM